MKLIRNSEFQQKILDSEQNCKESVYKIDVAIKEKVEEKVNKLVEQLYKQRDQIYSLIDDLLKIVIK